MLEQLAQSFHDNEPKALRYQVFRKAHSHDGNGNIVVIEQYASLYSHLSNVLSVGILALVGTDSLIRFKNLAAFEQHLKTEGVLELLRRAKEEDVFQKAHRP